MTIPLSFRPFVRLFFRTKFGANIFIQCGVIDILVQIHPLVASGHMGEI